MAEIDDKELEQLRAEAAAGKNAAAALEKAQADSNERMNTTMEAFRHTTRAAHPNIPAELIAGDTPEDIAASVERGKAIVEKVTAANKPTTSSTPSVTAAAPPRTIEVPEGITGAARIRYGLEQLKKQ